MRRIELLGTQHHTGRLVRTMRVGFRKSHRHVDVMTARVECGCEYRRIETGIARVQHDVDAFPCRDSGDCACIRSVVCMRDESRIRAPFDRHGSTDDVDVRDYDMLEDFGFRSRASDRSPYAAGSNHENAHAFTLRSRRRARAALPRAPSNERRVASGH